MAFGGREIRLALSVQSYGVTNLRNLRRDLAGLQSYTEAANRRQAQLVARNARDVKKYATLQRAADAFPGKRTALAEKELGIKSQIASADARAIKAQQQLVKGIRTQYGAQERLAALQRASVAPGGMQSTRWFKSLNTNAKVAALQFQAANLAIQKGQATLARMPELAAALAQQEAIVNDQLAAQGALIANNEKELAAMQATIGKAALLDQATQMERVGRQVAHIGRMMQFAGLLVSAGFGMAAGSFANFSNEASLAGTQMRDIGAPMTQAIERAGVLTDAITKLMMRFPATAEDMSKAAYDIFSSMDIVKKGVVDVASGMRLLELANRMAVAGGVSLAEATNTMITILNNFDPELKQVGYTMNTVFSIVRYGRMHLDELGAAMQKLAPIAKTTGISLEDVGGAFAALTIMFPRVQDAAAGLSRAMEMFRMPQVQKGLEAWGVTITDVHNRLLPLDQVIGRLIKRFPEMATSQKSALEVMMQITKLSGMTKVGIQGTVQARRAIAALASNYALYGDVLANVRKNKGELDAAFAARMEDPGVQWQIFLNTLRALVLMIGKEALPVFLRFGRVIAGFIDWFHNLNPAIRQFIVQGGAMTGLLFLFGGTIVNIVGSLVALKANLVIAGLAAEETAGKFSVLRLTLGTLGLVTFGAVIASIYGIQDALVYTTAAWLVWKTRALQSLAAVVTANTAAAATTANAWRAALIRTGFGILVVLAAVAVSQIMKHWDEFRAYFFALGAAIKTGWRSIMDYVVGYTLIGISKMQDSWYSFLNQLIPFMGDAAKWIDEQFGTTTDNMRRLGEELVAQSDAPEEFRKRYKEAMDKFAEDRKKNGSDFDKWLKRYQGYAGRLVTNEFLQQQEDYADQLFGGKNADKMVKARTDAVKAATTEMENTIKSATDNMMNIWRNFYQQNVQALGGLFQGPVMQGIFGNIFTQLNSTLKQFGIQIPIPFNILKQDLDMSVEYFKRWRADISKLLKMGVPVEMVQEIEAMGPDAGIPIAEGLIAGGKGGVAGIVKEWKKMHGPNGALQKATQEDMNRQLNDWKKHGTDAAWAMVSGFGQSLQDPKLRAQFSAYITNNFGSILKQEFTASVNAAVEEAAAQAQAAAKTIKPPKIPDYSTGGKPMTALERARAGRNAARRQYQATIDKYTEATLAARTAGSEAGRKIGPGERKYLNELWSQVQFWNKQVGINTAKYLKEREKASIRRQIRQERRMNPNRPTYIITYGGETVTVHADGATVQSVMRALDKKRNRRRNRNKTKATNKP